MQVVINDQHWFLGSWCLLVVCKGPVFACLDVVVSNPNPDERQRAIRGLVVGLAEDRKRTLT